MEIRNEVFFTPKWAQICFAKIHALQRGMVEKKNDWANDVSWAFRNKIPVEWFLTKEIFTRSFAPRLLSKSIHRMSLQTMAFGSCYLRLILKFVKKFNNTINTTFLFFCFFFNVNVMLRIQKIMKRSILARNTEQLKLSSLIFTILYQKVSKISKFIIKICWIVMNSWVIKSKIFLHFRFDNHIFNIYRKLKNKHNWSKFVFYMIIIKCILNSLQSILLVFSMQMQSLSKYLRWTSDFFKNSVDKHL